MSDTNNPQSKDDSRAQSGSSPRSDRQEGAADASRSASSGPNQGGPNQGGPNQGGPNQGGQNQGGQNQGGQNQGGGKSPSTQPGQSGRDSNSQKSSPTGRDAGQQGGRESAPAGRDATQQGSRPAGQSPSRDASSSQASAPSTVRSGGSESRSETAPQGESSDKNDQVFEALECVVDCLESVVRELPRGPAAQLKGAQDQLRKARELIQGSSGKKSQDTDASWKPSASSGAARSDAKETGSQKPADASRAL